VIEGGWPLLWWNGGVGQREKHRESKPNSDERRRYSEVGGGGGGRERSLRESSVAY